MFRSPIFILLLLFLFTGCSKSRNTITDKSEFSSEDNAKAVSLRDCADTLLKYQKTEQAFAYFHKSKLLFEQNKDEPNIAYCLIKMAECQREFCNYVGVESLTTEALPLLDSTSVYYHSAQVLLGIAYKERNQYDNSIKCYQTILKHTKDSLNLSVAQNNIASLYIDKKQFQKAIQLLVPMMDYAFLNEHLNRKAIYQDNLGFCYYQVHETKKGLQLMYEALNEKIKLKDSYHIIESYLHLAECYLQSDPLQAFQYASKANEYASQTKSIDERLAALSLMIQTSSSPKVKEYSLQYIRLKDSIETLRNTYKNEFAKIRYDSTKDKAENLRLKNSKAVSALALQKSQNKLYIMLFGLILLLVVFGFVLYYFQVKRKQERVQTAYLTEIRIAKKVHDELANDVFQTMSYATSKPLDDPENKEELVNLLENIYQRSRNISKENDVIHTGERFQDELFEMLNSFRTEQLQVILKLGNTILWDTISHDSKITIFRVLQELMINMKKHSQASIVVVGFLMEDQRLKIDYADNGTGFSMTEYKKSGLQNVENRIHAIAGTITFETENGCKIKITLPK